MNPEPRWYGSKLPDEVRAAMLDLLAEGLRQAAREEDPGDGSMFSLRAEKELGLGMWDGGWKLQTSMVQDERMNPRPFVIVHAYQGSSTAKASVSLDITRTADDLRYLATRRLDALRRRRDELTAAIDKLQKELEL